MSPTSTTDPRDHPLPRRSATFLPLLASWAVFATLFSAQIGTAANVGPGQRFTSIAAAINGTKAGETIIVFPGIYSEPRLTVASRTLTSSQPTQPGATVIQNVDGRAVIQASNATIEGFTIAGGRNAGGHGGGVSLMGGEVILKYLTIVQNSALGGGGVGGITGSAKVRIENCTISNNTATNRGGGVEGPPAGTTIADSVIKDNRVNNSSPTGVGAGGGVFLPMFSTANIVNTEITLNQASGTRYGYGGGIYSNANLTLGGVTLKTNRVNPGTSISRGGGIFISRIGSTRVNGGSVSANTAGEGAGIWVNSGFNTVSIRTSVSTNTATQPIPSGGGIFCGGAIQTLGGQVSGNSPDQIVGCGPGVIPPVGTTRTATDNGQGGSSNDPVSTRTGELYNQFEPDLNLRGPMPLFFARYYSSAFKQVGIFADLGDNWRHNFDWRLTLLDDTIHIVDHRGRTTQFSREGAAWNLIGKTDVVFQLAEDSGHYTLLDPRDQRSYLFDNTGLLLNISDGRGNVHTLSYANGPLTQVSDGLGRVLSFTYDEDANLATVDDGLGRSVIFTYTNNYLTGVTDLGGETTAYNYSTAHSNLTNWGLFTTMVRPEGNTPFEHRYWFADRRSSSELDSNGHKTIFRYVSASETTIEDPLGNIRTHTHTATGELSGSTDNMGRNIAIGSDGTGRRNSITDRFGDVTTMSYHPPSGKLASRTHADGVTTSYSYTARAIGDNTAYDLTGKVHADLSTESVEYDALGNLTSHLDQLGNPATATYNASGQPLTVTNRLGGTNRITYHPDATLATRLDPAGNPTSFDYDGFRRLNLITRADDSTVAYTYDDSDRLLTIADGNSHLTTLSYDLNGNLESIVDPLLHSVDFAYDGNDRLLRVTSARGGATRYSYDQLGRIGTTTDPLDHVTSYGYDLHNRLSSVTDPLLRLWSTSYDLEGIISSHTDPLLNTTSYLSDKLGRITEVRSPLGNTTRYTYDAMGRITSTSDSLDRTTTFSRDARGAVSEITLPGGAIRTSFSRNASGQVTEQTDPNGHRWSGSHDTSGRLISRTDPLLRTTGVIYDNRNRPSMITLPGGLGTQTNTYDATGNLTGVSYSDGTALGFVYDANNRLTSASSGGPDDVTASYDADGRIDNSNGMGASRDLKGRITSLTLAPGKGVHYDYDANDRLTTVRDWAGGVVTFGYDAAGRLTAVIRPSGVNTTNTWDNDQRLVAITESGVSDISLTRDAAGQITAATRNVPQAASAPIGVNRSFSFDAAAQLAGASYDTAGRLTADGANTFTWDLATRLTTYSIDGNAVGCSYDALGRRTSRSAGGVTRDYLWNDALSLSSISVESEGGMDRWYYIHTPGGELLYRMDATTNARNFYHYDEMGNTLFLSDDGGAVIGSYAYTPYGGVTASSGGLGNPFTWQGRTGAMDEGNGLYYLRARYYHSVTGRFISRDPIEQTDPKSINPYQYAWGNPLLYIDPSGEEPETQQQILDRLQNDVEKVKKEIKSQKRLVNKQWKIFTEIRKSVRETEKRIHDGEKVSATNIALIKAAFSAALNGLISESTELDLLAFDLEDAEEELAAARKLIQQGISLPNAAEPFKSYDPEEEWQYENDQFLLRESAVDPTNPDQLESEDSAINELSPDHPR